MVDASDYAYLATALVFRPGFTYNPQITPLNPRFSPTTFIRCDDLLHRFFSFRRAADKRYSLAVIMEPVIRYCPRCSTQLTAFEEPKQPRGFLEDLFLHVSANIFVDVVVVALVAAGFVFWFAWVAAVGVLFWAYFATRGRPARYSCSSCGISFPREMVLNAPKPNVS